MAGMVQFPTNRLCAVSAAIDALIQDVYDTPSIPKDWDSIKILKASVIELSEFNRTRRGLSWYEAR